LTASQADTLSGATDSEIDLTYPTIGESTYYTTVYRLLHRLGLLGKVPGNSLRVYKDGELCFGVRPGQFTDGATARNYAGASAQPLTDEATNYIYLSTAGVLSVNTTGFPDPAATPHVPLATIVAADGSYDLDDVTDCRGRAIFRAAVDRAALTQQDSAVYAVPLTRCTQRDGQPLPTAPDGNGGDMALVAGTHGSASPILAGSLCNNTANTEYARLQFALPAEYVAGESVTIRVRARTSVALTVSSAVRVDVRESDRQGGVSASLCGQSQNVSTSWADKDYAVTATNLAAGDLLDILLTSEASDLGGAANGRIEIGSVQLLLDVKG
jgi:hypothetical protein